MIMGPVQGEDGLAWEVRRIFELQQIPKLVLVMPPLGEKAAQQRWEIFRPLCQNRLPEYQGRELAAAFTRDGSCIVEKGGMGRRWRRDEATYRRSLLIYG
jgi:hypothetical protein